MAQQVIYPAGKSLTWLPVTNLASGVELRLPLHHVVGAHPGLVLGITAGIHGDEYLPMEVVRQVVTGLDPSSLHGSVLAIPVANPLAFEAQTRNTPHDMVNLNRVFPGDPNGWLTEQLASVICERYLSRIECLIDLHCGGAQPTVDYAYILNDEAMSRAFGFESLYLPPHPYEGTLTEAAVPKGIRCVVVEMGGGMLANDSYIARGIRGVQNVMKHLGMIPGEPVVPAQQTVVHNMHIVRPHCGGLLYPSLKVKDIGTVVPKGTLLGAVVSPYTFETLEEMHAPFERSLMILLRGAITRVHPGDYAYMIAEVAA